MFNIQPTATQLQKIDQITGRYLQRANLSQSETAWCDCYRKGMDAVLSFCRKEGLPVTGRHVASASLKLQG